MVRILFRRDGSVITLIYHLLKMMIILLHQVSLKKMRIKTIMNKMIIEIIFTIVVIVYFAVEVPCMDGIEGIFAQIL